MFILTPERLQHYRCKTFRSDPALRLTSLEDAVRFVDERGFIFFWPIKGYLLPSLWTAVAGDRPVPNEHDDPGHITWGWKDKMLGEKQWYYARLLRRKNSFVSLACLPYFYALSPNYGDYEHDYLDQYALGQMTQEAKTLYENLLFTGALDSLELRRKSNLWGKENNTRFNRALEDLQIELKIMPVGIAQVGTWKYAFKYDLTVRYFNDLPQQALAISELCARKKLIELYLLAMGAVPEREVYRLFAWQVDDIKKAIQSLEAEQIIYSNIQMEGQSSDWIAHAHFMVGN